MNEGLKQPLKCGLFSYWSSLVRYIRRVTGVNNDKYTAMNEQFSTFKITCADDEHCQDTFKRLEELTSDRYMGFQMTDSVTDKFVGMALEGLVVFLSCKRKGLNLQGSFVHHDEEADQQEFKKFVSRLDPEANIKLDTKVVTLNNHPLCFS